MSDKVKNEAALAPEDNPEWTEQDFAKAMPASQALPAEAVAALTRGRGRPPTPEDARKVPVSIRLSPEVLDHFRALGRGWQTRIDELLKAHVANATSDDGVVMVPVREVAEAREAREQAPVASNPRAAKAKIMRDAQTGRMLRVSRRGSAPKPIRSKDGK